MRYLLAIGGLLLGAVAIAAIWLLLPRSDAPPSATEVAAQETAETPAVPITADAEGDGSLRVCNQTANPVSIALGYRVERGWQSEGWWVANPGECTAIFQGDVAARRYYYIYAADDVSGGSWDGNFFMCTRDESFTIFDEDDCLARGYERTGFFEIDTQYRSSWMLQLTENQALGAEPVNGIESDAPMDGAFDEGSETDAPADEDAEGAADE